MKAPRKRDLTSVSKNGTRGCGDSTAFERFIRAVVTWGREIKALPSTQSSANNACYSRSRARMRVKWHGLHRPPYIPLAVEILN